MYTGSGAGAGGVYVGVSDVSTGSRNVLTSSPGTVLASAPKSRPKISSAVSSETVTEPPPPVSSVLVPSPVFNWSAVTLLSPPPTARSASFALVFTLPELLSSLKLLPWFTESKKSWLLSEAPPVTRDPPPVFQ